MAQLLIIVGFKSNWREDPPVPVYMGRDDDAGEKAMQESDCQIFHVHRNLAAAHKREKAASTPIAPQAPPAEDSSAQKAGKKAGK